MTNHDMGWYSVPLVVLLSRLGIHEPMVCPACDGNGQYMYMTHDSVGNEPYDTAQCEICYGTGMIP